MPAVVCLCLADWRREGVRVSPLKRSFCRFSFCSRLQDVFTFYKILKIHIFFPIIWTNLSQDIGDDCHISHFTNTDRESEIWNVHIKYRQVATPRRIEILFILKYLTKIF